MTRNSRRRERQTWPMLWNQAKAPRCRQIIGYLEHFCCRAVLRWKETEPHETWEHIPLRSASNRRSPDDSEYFWHACGAKHLREPALCRGRGASSPRPAWVRPAERVLFDGALLSDPSGARHRHGYALRTWAAWTDAVRRQTAPADPFDRSAAPISGGLRRTKTIN